MNYKLKLDPRISENYPDYTAFVIYASNLTNSLNDDYSTQLLQEAQIKQREAFGSEKPSNHPHIAAWREVYKSFGSKPSKYLCSVEALLSRTLKGNDLPTINSLVDIYNAISINYVLPVGGEDWEQLSSDLTLTIASGKEPFVTYENGAETVIYPDPGEVIWADSTGVTCLRWNWRQCRRTALTVDTRHAYFVLDRLSPYSIEQLMAAGLELIQHLKHFSPECSVNYELLGEV
jgi:DNA/RNA-binding domain of Phe-tRNA-synthetase-like protein